MIMIYWVCDVSLKDGKSFVEFRNRLGLICLRKSIQRSLLKWFGRIERMDVGVLDEWM